MKADIKVAPWVPILFLAVAIFFALQEFNALDIIMISGSLLIIVYFVLAYIKRKDALIIEGNKMFVRSPFKVREFDIDNITNVFTNKGDAGVLKATYEDEIVSLCTNIYQKDIHEVKEYLLKNYPHIEDKSES